MYGYSILLKYVDYKDVYHISTSFMVSIRCRCGAVLQYLTMPITIQESCKLHQFANDFRFHSSIFRLLRINYWIWGDKS